jgi:hypothetical protein
MKKNLNKIITNLTFISNMDLSDLQWNLWSLSVCRTEPSRIKCEFVTANRTRILSNFLIIFCFFCNKFGPVRSNRTKKICFANFQHKAMYLWTAISTRGFIPPAIFTQNFCSPGYEIIINNHIARNVNQGLIKKFDSVWFEIEFASFTVHDSGT